ncbi:unnamed protein product [Orchesella dallaii]|uniref:Uncharacterized protein n=1 Tax=Orchesella dallaii TaxID=48710 RepID=A0ABP1RGS6_9HEXA
MGYRAIVLMFALILFPCKVLNAQKNCPANITGPHFLCYRITCELYGYFLSCFLYGTNYDLFCCNAQCQCCPKDSLPGPGSCAGCKDPIILNLGCRTQSDNGTYHTLDYEDTLGNSSFLNKNATPNQFKPCEGNDGPASICITFFCALYGPFYSCDFLDEDEDDYFTPCCCDGLCTCCNRGCTEKRPPNLVDFCPFPRSENGSYTDGRHQEVINNSSLFIETID